ncbi:calcium/manganese antiporter SLC30A10 isoform X2 [Periplaneta americana]|uniref:calcium/manganese antiporter SLC30A10 isoform X2 n=1 Tax=Periplaneta americana TaxID=6978 RepID=UPI0037E8248C
MREKTHISREIIQRLRADNIGCARKSKLGDAFERLGWRCPDRPVVLKAAAMDTQSCASCEEICEQCCGDSTCVMEELETEEDEGRSLLDATTASMAMKKWFRHLQPVQLYLLLGLTALFFLVQLVMSHMTHALTLLVDSYHMLCNLIALVGCIITIKCNHHHHHHHHHSSSEEKKLKNTFGWARIDVLVMLIGCVFLASLCFSLVVEALQTLVHIEHHDEMHHPIPVMCVGACGLLLNGLCYLLIGGYTFHQGSFLHVTPSGGVVLDGTVTKDSVQKGERHLSAETRPASLPQIPQRQGIREMCRDIIGCIFVIGCSLIVYFTDQQVAKYVDPALSIVSAILLFVLSYPYMKESGSILLQTIPDTINIDSLRSELLKAFPDIINVHDLHVWRLTATKVFSTAHIIFLNSKDYVRITKDVTEFFHDQGITQVTIQPEFFKMDNRSSLMELPSIHANHCLVQCRELGCHSRHCCSHNDQELVKVTIGGNSHNHHSHNHSHQHSKDHKKHHVATRVKELVTQRRFTSHGDPTSACRINTSFETTSNEDDTEVDKREEKSEDANASQSNVGQEVVEIDNQKNEGQGIKTNYVQEYSDAKSKTVTDCEHKNVNKNVDKMNESSEAESEEEVSDNEENLATKTKLPINDSNTPSSIQCHTISSLPESHDGLSPLHKEPLSDYIVKMEPSVSEKSESEIPKPVLQEPVSTDLDISELNVPSATTENVVISEMNKLKNIKEGSVV